jgi:hypothetical protein
VELRHTRFHRSAVLELDKNGTANEETGEREREREGRDREKKRVKSRKFSFLKSYSVAQAIV